jgi:hypothetical protein
MSGFFKKNYAFLVFSMWLPTLKCIAEVLLATEVCVATGWVHVTIVDAESGQYLLIVAYWGVLGARLRRLAHTRCCGETTFALARPHPDAFLQAIN